MSNVNAVTNNKGTVAEHGTNQNHSHYNTRSANSAMINYVAFGPKFGIPEEITDLEPSMELITPEIANEYLATMNRNRRLNQGRVSAYMRDLNNGTFTVCLDPICFDTDGHMINGQHRCEAISRSGVPAWILVLRNVWKNTVIDKGLGRSIGQSLYMRGHIDEETSKSVYSTVCKLYLDCKHFNGYSSKSITEDQIGDFINANYDNLTEAVRISGLGTRRRVCKKAAVQVALFAALYCGVSPDTLERFVDVVGTRIPENKYESSAMVFRSYLDDNQISGESSMLQMEIVAESAINDFVNGRPRSQRYLKPKHVYIDKCNADVI